MDLDLTSIITTLVSTFTAIVLIFTYRQDMNRDKPQFDFSSTRGTQLSGDLNGKPIALHIQNPTKPIEYCQIFCNAVALETPFGMHSLKGIYIRAGSSADFFLPKNISEKDNPTIIVKDGKSTLKKKKLQDILTHFKC